jgi:argininosuccinate lyase
VRAAEDQKIKLDQLTLDQLKSIDARFEPDVADVWNYEVSVERKKSIGGTAKASCIQQINNLVSFANSL